MFRLSAVGIAMFALNRYFYSMHPVVSIRVLHPEIQTFTYVVTNCERRIAALVTGMLFSARPVFLSRERDGAGELAKRSSLVNWMVSN